ncbi:MAG: dethiobiotin synthase [Ginsengibacter sp.]
MLKSIFITGIGTDVGKTIISAIVTEALQADYWKPVQSGYPADKDRIKELLSNERSVVYKELYKFKSPVSPHLAAATENAKIDLDHIVDQVPKTKNTLVIEGAGGLMVPLNSEEFIIDLIRKLGSSVIIVSDHYLGSINHSLMTSTILKNAGVDVLGWIFNGGPSVHEDNIIKWSNLPMIASIPKMDKINKEAVGMQAELIKVSLEKYL